MNDYIKALFAVKEDGNALPLVIKEAKKQEKKLLFTYKKASKVWTEEFYINDFYDLCDYLIEGEYTFPNHEELSLYLKNEPSKNVEELLMSNGISNVIAGFVILEYYSNEFCAFNDCIVKEYKIYKHTDNFAHLPLIQSRELIPEIKEFYSCENDFDDEKNFEIKNLHIHNIPVLNGSYYIETDDVTRRTIYGCKHGKIYARTNNFPESLQDFYCEEYYNGYEEDKAEWENIYGHLESYYCTVNSMKYLDRSDFTKMIDSLEECKQNLIAEKEKQLEDVENQIKYINSHIPKD